MYFRAGKNAQKSGLKILEKCNKVFGDPAPELPQKALIKMGADSVLRKADIKNHRAGR